MKYLNIVSKNQNFFVDKELLFNIHSNLPIADLSNNQYVDGLKKDEKVKEFVELYESGAKVTVECGGESCIQFFGNDGKMLTETFCHKGQNRENISILPIDLGVFSSHYVDRKFGKDRLLHMFVDYNGRVRFMDHNFNNVFKSVKDFSENNLRKFGRLNPSEKFKRAIQNVRREQVREARA